MFGPRAQSMLVITVGILSLFALIPILAATTAEYTHTPLQGLILTNAHVIPGQETKAMYILQSAWFSIRHAEREALESLSDSSYEMFHSRINSDTNPLGEEALTLSTKTWLGTYLRSPNAQLTVGLDSNNPIRIASSSKAETESWEKYPMNQPYRFVYYEAQNGKLVDMMPIPTTVMGYDQIAIDDDWGVPYEIDEKLRTYQTSHSPEVFALVNTHVHTVGANDKLSLHNIQFDAFIDDGTTRPFEYQVTAQKSGGSETIIKTGTISVTNAKYNPIQTFTIPLQFDAGKGESVTIKLYVRHGNVYPRKWLYILNIYTRCYIIPGIPAGSPSYGSGGSLNYDPTTAFKYSYGTYNVPFVVNTLNSYYRFAYPYLVRNEQMVTVIEDVLKDGGIYDSSHVFYPNPYVYQYPITMYQNSAPSKTTIVKQLSDEIAIDIANKAYALHASQAPYDEIEFDIDLVVKASEWEAHSQITEDRCVTYYYVDGYKSCRWVTTAVGKARVCHCEYYTYPGYRRVTSAAIMGSCTIDLDQISVTVREMNGETAATTQSLIIPAISNITKNDDIRLTYPYDFYITYGPTDSSIYQKFIPSTTYNGCSFNQVSALSCQDVMYPGWYLGLQENTNKLALDNTIYVPSSITRKW